MKKGLSARTSETIGMAQRGGCVTSHVRFTDDLNDVSSPIIGSKSADMIIAMELAETVRVLPLLKEGGAVMSCNNAVFPITGSYDADGVMAYLKKAAPDSTIADCQAFIKENGAKTLNVFLLALAAASGKLPISANELEEAVREAFCGNQKLLEINLKAFTAGKEAYK